MVTRVNNSRPPLRRDQPSSSSLEGMERPWPSRPATPRAPRVESIIHMYMEKPLPPTPAQLRLPQGSLRSLSADFPPSQLPGVKVDGLPSRFIRKYSLKRSSTSRVPDRPALRSPFEMGRPLYSEDLLTHRSSSDLSSEGGRPHSPQARFPEIHPGTRVRTPDASKEPQFTEWKAPVYRPPEKRPTAAPPRSSKLTESRKLVDSERMSSSHKGRGLAGRSHGSRPHAEEYRALIYGIPLGSPESSANSFQSGSDSEPSPTPPIQAQPDIAPPKAMSPRISDVLDQPLIPEILNVESGDEENERRPSTPFSSDDENVDGKLQSSWRSFRARTENPFRRRPSSKYPKQGAYPDSTLRSAGLGRSSQHLSNKKQHRQSFQQGVSDTYESLQRKISSSSKTHQPEKEITREFRNPAVPMTLYQSYGKKAWEGLKGSSKLAKLKRKSWLDPSPEPSPGRIEDYNPDAEASTGRDLSRTRGNSDESIEFRMAARTDTERSSKKDRSVGKKLASAFQTGNAQMEHRARLDKETGKQAKMREQRREELKREIVVVLPQAQAKP